MTPAELRALAKRVCEEAPSRELDSDVAAAVGFLDWTFSEWLAIKGDEIAQGLPCPEITGAPTYTTSLDAAASLMPEGWSIDVCVFVDGAAARAFRNAPPLAASDIIRAPTETKARVAAALLAMAADMEARDGRS